MRAWRRSRRRRGLRGLRGWAGDGPTGVEVGGGEGAGGITVSRIAGRCLAVSVLLYNLSLLYGSSWAYFRRRSDLAGASSRTRTLIGTTHARSRAGCTVPVASKEGVSAGNVVICSWGPRGKDARIGVGSWVGLKVYLSISRLDWIVGFHTLHD